MLVDLGLAIGASVAILVAVPGIVMYAGGSWRGLGHAVAFLVPFWLLVGILTAVTGLLPLGFAILVPVTGLVIGAGVWAVSPDRARKIADRMLILGGFCLLVYLPMTIGVFGGDGVWLYQQLGGLDFAGAIPVAIGGGVFTVAMSIGAHRHTLARPRAVPGIVLVWLASVGWAVGFELRVDRLTPIIALNMVLTPVVASGAAMVVERIRTGRSSREGSAAGGLSGIAAALGACAYLEPAAAVLLGLLSGSLAAVAYRGDSAARGLGVPLLVGGGTGLLFLGIFALGPGFVYSGQPTQLVQQVLVVAASLAYAVLSTAIVLLGTRGLRVLRR